MPQTLSRRSRRAPHPPHDSVLLVLPCISCRTLPLARYGGRRTVALPPPSSRQAENRARELEAQLARVREETARMEAEIAAKVEALHEREYR
jgi:hypothetical protein